MNEIFNFKLFLKEKIIVAAGVIDSMDRGKIYFLKLAKFIDYIYIIKQTPSKIIVCLPSSNTESTENNKIKLLKRKYRFRTSVERVRLFCATMTMISEALLAGLASGTFY